MSISTGIASNIRTPLFYARISNEAAGYSVPYNTTLLLGHSIKDVPEYEPFLITTIDQAKDKLGTNSMLTAMVEAYMKNDSSGELYVMALPEPAGIKAKGQILFEGTIRKDGLINLYIAGQKITALAYAGETGADVAPRVIAAINAEIDLPVMLSSNVENGIDGLIELEAVHRGAIGNDIYIELNYYEHDNPDEYTPEGLSISITQLSGGVGTPDLEPVFSAIDDDEYYIVAHPWSDIASLDAFKAEFDLENGRWGPEQQKYGFHFTARKGDVGELQTFGANNTNDPTGVSLGYERESLTTPWEAVSMLAGQTCPSLTDDPARPLQTLALNGFMPPKNRKAWLKRKERNLLLWNGVATIKHTRERETQIEALISMYRVNKYGQRDPSYLYINTLANLGYQLKELNRTITQKYPRHKLVNDGTKFKPGQAIVTPAVQAATTAALNNSTVQGEFSGGLKVDVKVHGSPADVRTNGNANINNNPIFIEQNRGGGVGG